MYLTRAQRESVYKVFRRKYPSANELSLEDHTDLYRKFRRKVQPYIGGDCVMVQFAGMWLGIETNGHTHS